MFLNEVKFNCSRQFIRAYSTCIFLHVQTEGRWSSAGSSLDTNSLLTYALNLPMSQQTERDTNLKESADANLSGHYIQYHVKYAVILECHHYDPVLAVFWTIVRHIIEPLIIHTL